MSILLRFNFRRCKSEQAIKNHHGLIIYEDRCCLERGHKGLHRGERGVWANVDRIKSFVDNEGRTL